MPPKGAIHVRNVRAAEQTHVYQQRVQVVEIAAFLEKPRRQWPQFASAAEERVAEGAE